MLKGISQSLMDSARERLEQETEKAAQEQKIIQLYIAHPASATVAEPKHVHAYKLYGSIGSIAWEDATPEQAVAIMEAFPPVPSGLDRGRSGTSYKPTSQVKDGDRATFQPGDGYALHIERHSHNMGEAKISWYTLIAGESIRLDVKLLAIWGVTPTLTGKVETYGPDGPVKRISNVTVSWGVKPPLALQEIRYSSGAPEYWNPFLVWAEERQNLDVPTLELVKAMAGECYTRRQHSKAAYQEDKAKGLAPEPATPYPAKGQLRSGTEAQHNCLNTEEARKDKALAEKHWREYYADSDPDSWPVEPSEYRKYFDHYTWACHWLALHDLHTDPNGPDGKPYKYGSAWL